MHGEWRVDGLNRRTVIAISLILLSITYVFVFLLPHVEATDVAITSVTPSSLEGIVGDSVNIIGTINTTDGAYQIWLGNHNVTPAGAKASGTNVNVTFEVPQIPGGNYTMTLQDSDKNINATTWFYVNTAYYIEVKKPVSPEQLQEGSAVEIWVNLTGGQSNTIYSANVTVKTPANQTFSKLVKLSNTTTTGEGHNTTIVYPTNFSASSHTNYTGTYTVTFNGTLATDTFFIGLTDMTEYHRNQTVGIKATGYKLNESITLKVTFGGKVVDPTVNVNATGDGIVYANWTVPSNATIGTYTLNVTSSSSSSPTTKNPKDIQNFTVPGFDVNITTRNLAKETVSSVSVRVFEDGKSLLNKSSVQNGLAQVKLEIGDYSLEAYYKDEKVGENQTTITGSTSLDFYCNLTNLKVQVVAVVDAIEIPIPEVSLYLTPDNETLTTNITGIAVAHSLLPNHNYSLNVSRYDMVPFNITTITQLPIRDWFNITIICPNKTLEVYVTDGHSNPIKDELKVTARELMGGLYYTNYTVNGTTKLYPAVGKYFVEIYGKYGDNYVKLNETSVALLEDKQLAITCKLFSLNVSIKVVDYFGQPITNVNVTLKHGDLQYSLSSQSGGVFTFNNIIGGDLQITVYPSGLSNPYASTTTFVDTSKVIEIKLEKYVVLIGFVVETAVFITAIIIVTTILLAILVEVYRRKRLKPQTDSSESENKE